jgi:hypothetical protein
MQTNKRGYICSEKAFFSLLNQYFPKYLREFIVNNNIHFCQFITGTNILLPKKKKKIEHSFPLAINILIFVLFQIFYENNI